MTNFMKFSTLLRLSDTKSSTSLTTKQKELVDPLRDCAVPRKLRADKDERTN